MSIKSQTRVLIGVAFIAMLVFASPVFATNNNMVDEPVGVVSVTMLGTTSINPWAIIELEEDYNNDDDCVFPNLVITRDKTQIESARLAMIHGLKISGWLGSCRDQGRSGSFEDPRPAPGKAYGDLIHLKLHRKEPL